MPPVRGHERCRTAEMRAVRRRFARSCGPRRSRRAWCSRRPWRPWCARGSRRPCGPRRSQGSRRPRGPRRPRQAAGLARTAAQRQAKPGKTKHVRGGSHAKGRLRKSIRSRPFCMETTVGTESPLERARGARFFWKLESLLSRQACEVRKRRAAARCLPHLGINPPALVKETGSALPFGRRRRALARAEAAAVRRVGDAGLEPQRLAARLARL